MNNTKDIFDRTIKIGQNILFIKSSPSTLPSKDTFGQGTVIKINNDYITVNDRIDDNPVTLVINNDSKVEAYILP